MMFEINQNKLTRTDLHKIVSNYEVLIYYDMPILFTGTNAYGNIIIGSSVDEDYENKIERVFHVIVDSVVYSDYLSQKTTYREILEKAESFFVIDRVFDESEEKVYSVDINEIPEEYLPTDESFCPKRAMDSILSYVVSLKGKEADKHLLSLDDLIDILEPFRKFLSKPAIFLKEFKLRPRVYARAFSPGSFKLHLDIKLDDVKQPDLHIDKDLISKHLNNYFNFCVNYLPVEVADILENANTFPPHFSEILREREDIFRSSGMKFPADLKDVLVKSITNSVTDLYSISKHIGDNFTHLEMINIYDGHENTLAVLDTSFSENISKSRDIIDEKFIGKVSADQKLQDYELLIYHLNTDSRRGTALIKDSVDSETHSRPSIKISGKEPLEETKYTESLYKSERIKIKGIAQRVGNKFRHIDINYENT
ncbi:hypothetical protein [Candidatus Magnetomonas plexicatena]|uniref:hypothetical protein n=1 Tax=Candidatus Magnetomonas plexicatena TaxID=2552947 RepID=UPI001100FC30|nr:hypothetical protein E2O03_013405 [Nitrospirales bacterium LBB_01]